MTQPTGAPADKAEAAAKARAYGFAEPIKYDYAVYGVKTGGDAEGEATSLPDFNWAANAAKYEYNEEYGEVGPRIPQLEQQLYTGEHIVRTGLYITKLHFKVTVEGPVTIHPIASVSSTYLSRELTY